MKKKYYFLLILVLIIIISLLPFLQRRLPLITIAMKSNMINFMGWDLIAYNRYECEKSFYFIKKDRDTIINFSFYYNITDHKCNYRSGLGDYDLIKEFSSNDSVFNLSVTLNGDTLFFNRRHKDQEFFVPSEGEFISGRYYFYYRLLRRQLDSCQIMYFEEKIDSLIKSGTNDIPEFDDNCMLLRNI